MCVHVCNCACMDVCIFSTTRNTFQHDGHRWYGANLAKFLCGINIPNAINAIVKRNRSLTFWSDISTTIPCVQITDGKKCRAFIVLING